MQEFYARLKTIFEDIPNKTKFLKDLGLNSSYSGFRYFMHGRRSEPTANLLSTISNELGYEYVQIPIRRNDDGAKLKEKLRDEFLTDLKSYSTKYEGDKARVYTQDFQGVSSWEAASVIQEGELVVEDEFCAADLF